MCVNAVRASSDGSLSTLGFQRRQRKGGKAACLGCMLLPVPLFANKIGDEGELVNKTLVGFCWHHGLDDVKSSGVQAKWTAIYRMGGLLLTLHQNSHNPQAPTRVVVVPHMPARFLLAAVWETPKPPLFLGSQDFAVWQGKRNFQVLGCWAGEPLVARTDADAPP